MLSLGRMRTERIQERKSNRRNDVVNECCLCYYGSFILRGGYMKQTTKRVIEATLIIAASILASALFTYLVNQ